MQQHDSDCRPCGTLLLVSSPEWMVTVQDTSTVTTAKRKLSQETDRTLSFEDGWWKLFKNCIIVDWQLLVWMVKLKAPLIHPMLTNHYAKNCILHQLSSVVSIPLPYVVERFPPVACSCTHVPWNQSLQELLQCSYLNPIEVFTFTAQCWRVLNAEAFSHKIIALCYLLSCFEHLWNRMDREGSVPHFLCSPVRQVLAAFVFLRCWWWLTCGIHGWSHALWFEKPVKVAKLRGPILKAFQFFLILSVPDKLRVRENRITRLQYKVVKYSSSVLLYFELPAWKNKTNYCLASRQRVSYPLEFELFEWLSVRILHSLFEGICEWQISQVRHDHKTCLGRMPPVRRWILGIVLWRGFFSIMIFWLWLLYHLSFMLFSGSLVII